MWRRFYTAQLHIRWYLNDKHNNHNVSINQRGYIIDVDQTVPTHIKDVY